MNPQSVMHRSQSEALAEAISDGYSHEAARYVIYLTDLIEAVMAVHMACTADLCPTVAALERTAR